MFKNFRSLLVALVCIALFGFMLIVVFPKTIEWRIKDYFQEKVGAKIEYDSLQWTHEGFVLSHLKVVNEEGLPLSFELVADKLKIDYSLQLFKRNIALSFTFISPHLSMAKSEPDFIPWNYFEEKLSDSEEDESFFIALRKSPKLHLLDTTIGIKVIDGHLELKGQKQLSSDWSFDWSKDHLSFVYGGGIHGATFQSNQLILQEVECGPLFETLEFIYGDPAGPWVLKQGIANGAFTLKESYIDGEGSFKDLIVEHRTSSIGGSIPEVKLRCSKAEVAGKGFIQNSKFEASFSKKASLYRFKTGLPYWMLRNIGGSITLNQNGKGLQTALDGQFFFSDKEDALFTLQGNLPVFQSSEKGNLLFALTSKSSEVVSADLSLLNKGPEGKEFDLSLNNVGPREYETIRNLWPEWSFVWEETQFLGGSLSLHVKGNLLPTQKLSAFSVEKIIGKNIWFKSNPLSIEGNITSLIGNIDFIIKSDQAYLKPRNGTLSLTDGDLYWESKQLQEGSEGINRFTNLNCQIEMEEGILQSGSFRGNLAGLQAELEFLGLGSEIVARTKVEGQTSKLVALLPHTWSEKIKNVQLHEKLSWQGELVKKEGGLFLKGSLNLAPLMIGLDAYFERLPKEEWEDANVKWKKWGVTLLSQEKPKLLPFQRKGSTHILKINWLKDDEGTWGIILRQGNFEAKRVSLQRWLEPFLPQDFALGGVSNLYGDFNDRSLILNFDLDDFSFDAKDFKMEIDQIRSREQENETLSDPSSFVYFDFQDETLYGFIPIKRGAYLDKLNNLQFSNISGLLSLSQNHLQLSQIECFSEDVHFMGSLDVDLSSKEAMNVEIKTSSIEGSVSAVQRFCSHFGSFAAWQWPLKGNLRAGENEVALQAWIPLDERKSSISWKVAGELDEGKISFPKYASDFSDMKMHFSFDSNEDILLLTEGEGELIVGSSDTYQLKFPQFSVTFGEIPHLDFDVWLQSGFREFARLKGATLPYGDHDMQLSLDPKRSHIGGFFPEIEECILTKEMEISLLKATPSLKLDFLLEDLIKLKATSIFPNAFDNLIENWSKSIDLQGIIDGKVALDNEGFLFSFEGSSVKKDGNPIKKCSFKAFGKGNEWKIENCQLGPFALQSSMEKGEDEIVIKELSLQDEGISANANGVFKDSKLNLHVINSSFSLADLRIIKNWKLPSLDWNPKGDVTLSGDLNVNFKPVPTESWITWSGTAALNEVEIRGNRIQNQKAIEMMFSNLEGLKFNDLALNIRQTNEFQYKATFNLRKAHYDFENEVMHLDGLGFALSTNGLRELALFGQDFFPAVFDDQTAAFLKDLKRQGGLQGELHIELGREVVVLRVKLSDGSYTLFGKDYALKNVHIQYTPEAIRASAHYLFQDLPLAIELQVPKQETNRGVVFVSEAKGLAPLKIVWQRGPSGFVVESIEGSVAGLSANMESKGTFEDKGQLLEGQIKLFDAARLKLALPKEMATFFQDWKIGSGYGFSGRIFIPNDDPKKFTVQGTLDGKDFQLLGWQLSSLHANIAYNGVSAVVSNFAINDPNIKLSIKELRTLLDARGKWNFSLPLLQIEKFKPYALAKDKKALKEMKNLVIQDFQLFNIKGILGESATITGSGTLTFEKVVKNSLGNLILSIPGDILGRIGLNMSVMTPAMGTINFDIRNRHFILTKLKDVYSEGKHSRFYMAKKPLESTLDFDGNLNMYVRIKQYNLILKLTEPLRIHITGRWDNPTYTFEKNTSPTK